MAARTRRQVLQALASVPIVARVQQARPAAGGFVFQQAPFASCHASTIVEAAPGLLLAAWFGGTREGARDVSIWLSRRGGSAWSAPQQIAADDEAPCWNPVLWRQPEGGLVLFYRAGPSPEQWSTFLKRSADGGRTWSDAEMLPAGLLGPIKNKPVTGPRGEIVAGSSVESHRAWTSWVEISPDGGRTWTKHGPIVVPGVGEGNIQPALWWTRDGRLRAAVRTTRRVGRVAMAESKDAGRTWGPARPTTLPNPNAGIDAARLADGRVAIVYNDSPTDRTPLRFALSEDDGDTWRAGLVLEDAPGEYSYPAVIQAADGAVHVTYTWRRQRIKHVMVSPREL